jgi:hypothetical protein
MLGQTKVNKVDKNHWDKFAEFCKYEKLSGGPDPQIKMVGEMSKDTSWEERVWRAGCYISVYNVPFAEAIWEHWSFRDMNDNHPQLYGWLVDNWSKIVTRIERKTVRRPEWMYEYFVSYYTFVKEDLMDTIRRTREMSPEDRYLYFWDITNANIRRYGRYVALKLLESYKQFCNIDLEAPDIRPKDGWSPRETLAVLFPQHAVSLNSYESRFDPFVNETALRVQQKLDFDYGVKVDLFQLQVMLCEYRESYESKKQYPGRSLDSELGYWHKRETLWGEQEYSMNMVEARQRIFPQQHLGEVYGWMGTRKDCGHTLADFGYTWSDMLYSYNATQLRNIGSLQYPVKWEDSSEYESI